FRAFIGTVVFRPFSTVVTNQLGVSPVEVITPTSNHFDIEARTEGGANVRLRINTGQGGRTGLEALSVESQIALQNPNFPRPVMIRTVTAGVPNPSNDLTISPTDSTITCPASATTNAEGVATFSCSANSVSAGLSRTVRVDVQDSLGRTLPERLTFTVVPEEQDLPRDPLVLTREEIVGPAGGTVEDAIRQRVIEISGTASVQN